MKISRSIDGMKFIAECDSESGFVPGPVECLHCGSNIEFHVNGHDVSLICSSCGITARAFWSEVQMYVYLLENWNPLREVCKHATLMVMAGAMTET